MNSTSVIVSLMFYIVISNCAETNNVKKSSNLRGSMYQTISRMCDDDVWKIISISGSEQISLSRKIEELLNKLNATQPTHVDLKLVNIKSATKQLVSRSNILYNIQLTLRTQPSHSGICHMKLLEQVTVGYQQLNINCGENDYQVTNGTPQIM